MAEQDRLRPEHHDDSGVSKQGGSKSDASPVASIDLEDLANSLNLGDSEHIALVGGGGKTTLLHSLGRQLRGSVILTTTTRMGSHQHGGFRIVRPDDNPVAAARTETVLVWGQHADARSGQSAITKVSGVAPEVCDRFAELVDYVVVEADGSRQLPFKAPAPFEPVVPASTTKLLSLIGADALGRVISDQCHRPLRVAALAQCHPYQRLDPAHAASVLFHPDGPRRASPVGAEYIVVITKVDDSSRPLAVELAHELLEREPDLSVLLINAGIDAGHDTGHAAGHTDGFSNTVHE